MPAPDVILNVKNIFHLNFNFTNDYLFFIKFTVNTLKISKPEKAQMVEGMIIRMAQMGLLNWK